MVFQDPMTLNPVLKVIDNADRNGYPRSRKGFGCRSYNRRAIEALAQVRIVEPERRSTNIHISFQVACANAWPVLCA